MKECSREECDYHEYKNDGSCQIFPMAYMCGDFLYDAVYNKRKSKEWSKLEKKLGEEE